jgi:hypothetical protein
VAVEEAHDAEVDACGVEETEPEPELLDVESSLWSSLDVEDVESSLLVEPVSYGSLDVSSLDEEVVVVVVVVLLVTLVDAIAGSSPACTRNASTLNTATTLAAAPAAKLRTLGTRRFGTFLGAGSPFVM